MSRFADFNLAVALQNVAARQSQDLTLRELVMAYHASHAHQGLDLRLKKWVAAFGDQSAWIVDRDELARAAQGMIDAGYKPSTVNRDLSALGQVYKWAVNVRRCSPRGFTSPTVSIPRFEETMRRVEVTSGQTHDLRAAALAFKDRRFGLLVHLLLDTGARKSELLARTWDDFDTERCEVTLSAEDTKTGKPRILHFTPATADLIKKLRPAVVARAQRVFVGRRGGIIEYRSSWRELRRMTGMDDLRMHDTRHMVAARMLRAGVTIGVAAQALGHSSLILLKRYGHLESDALRAAQAAGWAHAGLTDDRA